MPGTRTNNPIAGWTRILARLSSLLFYQSGSVTGDGDHQAPAGTPVDRHGAKYQHLQAYGWTDYRKGKASKLISNGSQGDQEPYRSRDSSAAGNVVANQPHRQLGIYLMGSLRLFFYSLFRTVCKI
tara:strand:+ start:1146 stop:1523 length:378 start_codon:yes stop_codon:yes gene_type:complete